ncbi:MAG: type II toxin-antitoxin system RelE/ParE family toxin [Planctomycetes bacterium]|nr:type II toxin-antitoxin system RelE/ParE family toxin [Planctomycetota bacterium]
MKVDLTSTAIRDLSSIDARYAERVEAEMLSRWRMAAEHVFESLARHPEIGAVVPWSGTTRAEFRSLRMPEPCHAYRVFYVLETHQLRVLRVLHVARAPWRWTPS